MVLKAYPDGSLEEFFDKLDGLDCEDENEDVMDADSWEVHTLEDYPLTPEEQIESMFSNFEQEEGDNDKGPFDERDERDEDEIFIPKRTPLPRPLISREDFARKCMIELAAQMCGYSTTKIIRDKEVMKRITDIINMTPQVEIAKKTKRK